MNIETIVADIVRRIPEMSKESAENNADLIRGLISKKQPVGKFKIGDLVRKIKGSHWFGKVVGTYSTELNPEGYAVESSTETGSVQIYPASALEFSWDGFTCIRCGISQPKNCFIYEMEYGGDWVSPICGKCAQIYGVKTRGPLFRK